MSWLLFRSQRPGEPDDEYQAKRQAYEAEQDRIHAELDAHDSLISCAYEITDQASRIATALLIGAATVAEAKEWIEGVDTTANPHIDLTYLESTIWVKENTA